MPRLEEIQKRVEIREEAERRHEALAPSTSSRSVWEEIVGESRMREGSQERDYMFSRKVPHTSSPVRDFGMEWLMAGDDEEQQKKIFEKSIKRLIHGRYGYPSKGAAAKRLMEEISRVEKRRFE